MIVIERARSPRFVPKLKACARPAMPAASKAVVMLMLRGCISFVVTLLIHWCCRLARPRRALPHEAGFFCPGPGSSRLHIFSREQSTRDLRTFLWSNTKQQSRLKYSQSLMSICLRLLVQHSFSRAQSSPSQIDTDTSTILRSFRQSQPYAEYMFLLELSDCRQVYAKSWVQPLLLSRTCSLPESRRRDDTADPTPTRT